MSLQRELLGVCAVAALVLLYFSLSSEHPLAPNLTMVIVIGLIQFFSLVSALVKLRLNSQSEQKVVRAASTQTFVQMLKQNVSLQCVALLLAVLALLGLICASGLSEDLLEARFDLCMAFLMGGGMRLLALPRRRLKMQNGACQNGACQNEACCSQCGDSDCSGSPADCPYNADFWGEGEIKLHENQNHYENDMRYKQSQKTAHQRQHQYKSDNQHNDIKSFQRKQDPAEFFHKPHQQDNQHSEVKCTIEKADKPEQVEFPFKHKETPFLKAAPKEHVQEAQTLDDVKRHFEQLDEKKKKQELADVKRHFEKLDECSHSNQSDHTWQQGIHHYPPGQFQNFNHHGHHLTNDNQHQEEVIHQYFNQHTQYQCYGDQYCEGHYYGCNQDQFYHGHQHQQHDNYQYDSPLQYQNQSSRHKKVQHQHSMSQHQPYQTSEYKKNDYQDESWQQNHHQDSWYQADYTIPGKKKVNAASTSSRVKKPMSQMKWVPKES
mmetsp:Transcript_84874/g.155690  ORF Transcript_84874/g.155690 Transcript_84874/m.155690 type:complete len:491 (-) Transcript_84874:102-1574(-)